MMIGTNAANHPMKACFLLRFLKASIQDFPVRLPMVTSVSIKVKPKVTTSMM